MEDKTFLLIDYTAKIKDTGEVIETTIEEEAKKAGIYKKDEKYEPLLVILGEKRVIEGLEEALYNMEEGEEREIEIPPEKAYGERDPRKIRVISIKEFRKAKVEPVPGKIVEINGVPAVVKSVSGGRVRVDFNHPLAGKTLIYKVKIVRKIDDPVEKVKYLVKRRIRRASPEKLEVNVGDSMVEIKIPSEAMLQDDIQIAKITIAREIFDYIDGVERVVFKEEIVKPKPKEEKKEEAEETEEEEESTGKQA